MLVAGLGWSSKAQADVSDFGIDSVSASISTTQAGGHPDLTQGFDLNRDPANGGSYASLRDAIVKPPAGLAGNPTQFPKCPTVDFIASSRSIGGPPCGQDTQIGVVNVGIATGPWLQHHVL